MKDLIEHPGTLDFDSIALESALNQERMIHCDRCGKDKYILRKCEGCAVLDAALCLCGHFGAGHTFWKMRDGQRLDICQSCSIWTLGLKEPFDRCHLFIPVSNEIMAEIVNPKSYSFVQYLDQLPMKIDRMIANKFYMDRKVKILRIIEILRYRVKYGYQSL